MKKNIVPIAVVVVLFACVAVVSFGSRGSSSSDADSAAASSASASDANVKICPHSGLPCEGDGDCEEDCEICEEETAAE
ncbi:MAG: hypothetical protein ACI4QC_07840 [Thermoguttaceae bacterium]